VGHLGTALLGYQGFAAHGLGIRAAFDIDPALAGQVINGTPVYAMEDLEPVLRRLEARMAILTVAPEAAQDVALRLARAGIEGIWNFTGYPLNLPAQVIVQDQDIAIGLAVLSAKLSARTRADAAVPPAGPTD
jgi:redox-sensing transcriptional repressor